VAAVTEELVARIQAANMSSDALRTVFAQLKSEVGPAKASTMWWAAFAETDAADT
jgi:hypothetical protein